ncbi:pectinesterase family protein [Saccharibacillus sp. JS10]|uniref:pectinesterase family protein n=1 Tax=Saccharibacillus sp. JS10 TaxID=2950552 RepID=UPI00210DD2B3|nr:pectinesterase family protein [Saccharibacillus sp. JS10]
MWVGKESFCDYATIGEAVEVLERQNPIVPETLYICSGTYAEQIQIHRSYLRIIGIGQVRLTMNRYAREKADDGSEIGTFATPTLFLGGSRLVVENVTIANTAGQGEHVGQAIALSAYCDLAVFRSCTFTGFQDTLFTGPLPPSTKKGRPFTGIKATHPHQQYRQLYLHCRIEGTVDYIFGGANAYFEGCELHSLARTGEETVGYMTAASTPQSQSFGYIFRDCLLTACSDVAPASVYLGRPWREYAQTVFINCKRGKHIHPAGWHNWGKDAAEQTVDYREYDESARHYAFERAAWTICESLADYSLWEKESIFADLPFW